MGPIITELNQVVALTAPVTFNGQSISQVTVERLIKRPIMKRVVFITTEMANVIIYDGEVEYEAHKDDDTATLIEKLKEKIAADYSA